jgi:hypothetical protein
VLLVCLCCVVGVCGFVGGSLVEWCVCWLCCVVGCGVLCFG